MSTIIIILYFLLQLFIGFVSCFFGYRYIRKLVMAQGFLFATFASYSLFAPISGLSTLLAVIFSILVGVLIAVICYFIYHVGLFFTGAGFGLVLSMLLVLLFGGTFVAPLSIILIIISGIAFGILAIVLRRPIIIISTSFNGASQLALNILYLVFNFSTAFSTFSVSPFAIIKEITDASSSFASSSTVIVGIATLILGIAGLLVQVLKTAPAQKGSSYRKRK